MTYTCGNCGASFDTKGDKRRHKQTCHTVSTDLSRNDAVEYGGNIKNPAWAKAEAARQWADIPNDPLSIATWSRGEPINPTKRDDAREVA